MGAELSQPSFFTPVCVSAVGDTLEMVAKLDELASKDGHTELR